MLSTLERASGLIRDLGSAETLQAYADAVVDGLWDLIPVDEVTFNEIDERARRIVVERTRSLFRPVDLDIWELYDDLPFCNGFPSGGTGVARMSGVLGRIELDRCPIYRDDLRPTGYRYSVEVVLPSPPSVRWAVLLGRSDRDFTNRECDLLALLLPHLAEAYRKVRLASVVTPREREVLTLVAEGLTNREIGRRLGISPGTVRSHLEHAYPKLGVSTRTAATSAVR
jgi:DNA-binding CsgD family transcriptional regulator